MSISKSAFRSALALILTGAVTLACQREPAAPLAGTGPMVGESGGTAQAPVGETADPQQFSALLAKGDALLLDVRTPGEVARGRIAGATNIDINDAAFESRIRKMQKNKPILVYCAVGSRSSAAVPLLLAAGFRHVVHLEGGIVGWSRAGLPVERGEAAPPANPAEALTPVQFDALLAHDKLVLADFHTPWCAPCQRMGPIVDGLSKKYDGKAKVVRVDIEASEALAAREHIDGVPVFVVYRGGKEVWRASGEQSAAQLEAQLGESMPVK